MIDEGRLPDFWPDRDDDLWPKFPIEHIVFSFENNVITDRARTGLKEDLVKLAGVDVDALKKPTRARKILDPLISHLSMCDTLPGLELWNLFKVCLVLVVIEYMKRTDQNEIKMKRICRNMEHHVYTLDER